MKKYLAEMSPTKKLCDFTNQVRPLGIVCSLASKIPGKIKLLYKPARCAIIPKANFKS